ncbi:MAG TPA: flavodoxin family protein [Dissulfurispiraceae bacterium]|nr:flavodoxin family protein [Dissulfurispiraceae bacterium]
MNILCVLGSPRLKGNSARIAQHFLRSAELLGAKTQTFALNTLIYRGCQACYACKKKLDRCMLDDDLTQVLDAMREADVIVLTTPIYFGDISGQLKCFIDRTFSFLVPDFITNPNPSRLPAGKKLLFVITQGQPDEALFADVFSKYERFLKWFGFSESFLIRACGVSKLDDVEHRDDIMRQAEDLAKKLVSAEKTKG